MAPSRRPRNGPLASQTSPLMEKRPASEGSPDSQLWYMVDPIRKAIKHLVHSENPSVFYLGIARDSLVDTINMLDSLVDRLGIPFEPLLHNRCLRICPTRNPPRKKTFQDVEVQVQPPSPPPRLYADVVCSTIPERTPGPLPSKPDPTPRGHPQRPATRPKSTSKTRAPAVATLPVQTARKPARLVVHIANPGCGYSKPPDFKWRYRILAESLSRARSGITVLGMHVNRKGNLLISFPDNTPRSAFMAQIPEIRCALGLSNEIKVTFDTRWSTIHRANVPTRLNPEGPVFSETELRDTLLLNPAIKDLVLASNPRWTRKPENIAGARSSAAISFDDADGSIARLLLKTHIFAFGAPITVKPWLAKLANNVCRQTPPRPPSSMDVE